MSWFDWLLIGGLAVLFVLALRHIIRQAKKGRCCGCSGCSGCEGCPSRSGCEEGLGRLEHEEDADSGRSAGQSAAGCRLVERLNKNTRKKRAAEGSRRLPAGKQLPAAPVRKNADAGGRFRWKMREGLGGSDHD
ncbi:MAG: hypothetical protein ACLSGG_05895 [[Clostridium] leptum]